MRSAILLLLLGGLVARAAGPNPETLKAWDHYISLTEAGMAERDRSNHFLWIDDHPREKSRVWLNQDLIQSHKTADVEIPDGTLQDWIGDIFLPGVTLEKVRDTLLDYASYKYWFKPDIVESKLEKRADPDFDSLLRIHRRQLQAVTLNIHSRTRFTELGPERMTLAMRSTHIGEVRKGSEEVAGDEEHGFLWRMNMYWRLQAADNGVYAEFELITLSRSQGRFASEKVLRGFVDNFPRSFAELTLDTARTILKPPKTGK